MNESRLHDYMDGLLPDAEMRAVEAHLDGCDSCQANLAEIAEVVEAVGDLPVTAVPTRDLWAGIDARISEIPQAARKPTLYGARVPVEPEVISLEAHRARGRGVTLTLGQLLAAGVVLCALSAGTMWTILGSPTGSAPVADAPEDGFRATFTAGAIDDYDLAVEELEAILAQGRRVLDPRTILILEESLREIDGAIAEASEALASDPGSPGLARALTNNMRRKLGLLRHAAGIIQAST